ncbi:H+-ATPase G subunit [Atractiella rhizophila]|nr:H+-ATPase G subunit [Atractiella rhizophila]
MSSSQGIQTLLEAEKEAQKIVSKAREYRVQRLKDARSQAAKEIEEYKATKEGDFQQFSKEHSGDTTEGEKHVNEQTDKELEGLKSSYEKNKENVVNMLLERLMTVDKGLHKNWKQN